MNQLADLRLALADARAHLRTAKDTYEMARAIAEQAAIERLNGSAGKNEAERSRNLTVALLNDETYTDALAQLRTCEAHVDLLSAQVAVEEDAVRLNEARIREKLADALLGRRMDEAAADIDWYDVAQRAERRKFDAIEEEAAENYAKGFPYPDPVFPAGSNAGGEYPR